MASSLTTHPIWRADAMSRGCDVGNAFPIDVGRQDPAVEGQAGQDGGLRSSIETFHVGGRIRLRIAELMGFGQSLCKACTVAVHLVEDEVCGAVDDPITEVISSPTSDSRSGRMIGMAPATEASKYKSAPARSASANSVAPSSRKQRLVRRDHRRTASQGGHDQGARRFDATDDLDDQVDVLAGHQGCSVGGEQALIEPGAKAVLATNCNPHELERPADVPGGRRLARSTAVRLPSPPCRSRAGPPVAGSPTRCRRQRPAGR